jgi:hypothetical protein
MALLKSIKKFLKNPACGCKKTRRRQKKTRAQLKKTRTQRKRGGWLNPENSPVESVITSHSKRSKHRSKHY